MAERRRRRRLSEEESGEDLSEDIKDTKTAERPSECESEDEPLGEDVEVSDYESVTEGKEPDEDGVDNEEDEESEESSEEDSDEESEEEETSEEEEDSDAGVDYADEDGLEEERHSGDGEEQPGDENDKELDDDEDRRNPAYVPRRGAFYEHDTRITEDTEKEQQRLAPKKKLWKDEGKWQHDRFREDLQAPKSREELMVLYGYDILASDKPPAAAPRINKSRMRNPQRRHQLKDFIGDPKWSGRRTSSDVQQKNYRNRRPARGGGGRNRLGDYGDSRKDYGDIRHEVIETRRDYGDSRRDYIDSRGDAEEKRKESVSEKKWEPVEVKRETSLEKRYHHVEEIKGEPNEKLSNDGYYKKEIYSANKEIVEVKKEVFEPRRDYTADVKKECGNNRRSGDSGDNRSRDHVIDNNRRDYGDHASGANVTWKVPNYVDRAHSNGEVKSNNNFRSNPKSAPSRQYTNANYRGENSDNSKIDSEHFSSPPSFKKTTSESNSNNNYKNLESSSYRGSDPRSYKANHDTAHRNNVVDNNRGYRNLDISNSAYSYRNNNENKQRTPERNFCHEEVTSSSLLKQKGAILNHVEFSGSVVTANNNVEKKSYSKERRMKGMSRNAMQQPHQTISPHESSIESERSSFTSENITLQQQEGKLDLNTGPSKTENVSRPKRYSTQRQRNLPEVNYPDQIPVDGTTYYSPNYSQFSLPEIRIEENSTQDFTQGPPPPPMFHPDQGPPSHQEGAAFQPTMLQAHTPIPYTLPVSTTGIPSPPRMFGPPPVPVSLATAPPAMLPPQYIGPGVIYGAPPPGPYQVPVIPGYQSPPPPPHSQTSGLQEMYRGGTTYYSTDLQQPSPSRSPVRRQKSAIPIINPQDVKNNTITTSANPTDYNASSNCADDLKKQDSVQESNSAIKADTAKSRDSAAECTAKPKPSESLTPTTSETAIESLSSLSKSCTLPSEVVGHEKSSSNEATTEEHETIAAHQPVELADTCAPSEQTTQSILEAAA